MTGFFQGAETDELRRAAEQFERAAQRMSLLARTLSDRSRSIFWTGEDAERWRSEGDRVFTALSGCIAEQISARARDLATHAMEQDAASAAGERGRAPHGGPDQRRHTIDPRSIAELPLAFPRGGGGGPFGGQGFATANVSMYSHEGGTASPDPRTAAERDQRDLGRAYLPTWMNFGAAQEDSFSMTAILSRTTPGAEMPPGQEFVSPVVTPTATITSTTSVLGESYMLQDGTRVFVASTSENVETVAGFEGEGVHAGRGWSASVTGGGYVDVGVLTEVSVPPGVELPLPGDFNPLNPETLPVGVSVRMDRELGHGTVHAADGSVEIVKGIDLGVGHSSAQGTSEGTSVVFTRIGEDSINVTSGPTEGFESSRGLSIGVTFGGQVEVAADFTASSHRDSYSYEGVDFDISEPAGQEAYSQFVEHGQFPEGGADGTSNRLTVEANAAWTERGTGLTVSFESLQNDTAGASADLDGKARQLTTGVEAYYHEDGSRRFLEVDAPGAGSGTTVYREGTIDAAGRAEVENYVQFEVTEHSARDINDFLGREFGESGVAEEGQIVRGRFSDAELDHLTEMQRSAAKSYTPQFETYADAPFHVRYYALDRLQSHSDSYAFGGYSVGNGPEGMLQNLYVMTEHSGADTSDLPGAWEVLP